MPKEHQRAGAAPGGMRPSLRPDCGQCFGLCCVAPAFPASADFAIDKAAGQPCPNLEPDFRCAIHPSLREKGFPGCTVYDCFGAGQKVSQVTFGGRDWRQSPATAQHMFGAFMVMRKLHELLWYLEGARELEPARPLRGELGAAFDEIERLTYRSAAELAGLDVAACRRKANALLLRTGSLVRAASAPHVRRAP